MREAFPEHFVGEAERQQKLWADCIFVLDTNVLLDLYRFSDSAREALFKVMESLGERLWIPYQVAAEYFDNRLTVIEAQSKAYAESITGLKVAKEKFNSGSRHPFVSEEVFNQFISSYDLMIKELEGKQETYVSYVSNDVIKAKLGTLLNGRVGELYSEEWLQGLAADGEKRYLENIPPGFQDCGKMPEATTNKLRLKKFGDLILWKQVIEKAKTANKPVILVTGEKKDDWWLKSGKRLVSALPALSKEFMDAVKQDFYLYATDRFLLKANEYLKQNTSEGVVEEVRAINKADAERKDDMDHALLDQALNHVWPESQVNDLWSNLALKAGLMKHSTPTWSSSDTEMLRNPQLYWATEQRAILQQRAQSMRAQLDAYRKERDELNSFQRTLLSVGVSPDDEQFSVVKERLSVLNALIEVQEEEFSALRNRMINIIAHQRALSDSDTDD
ncbi:hypothetical protein D3C85_887370 [compost metagenome]